MVEPIKPANVALAKIDALPDVVIASFNSLIAKHWDGSASKFTLQEARELLMREMDCTSESLFENGYMNIEPIYEMQGWKVYYDKPGYNESYNATYTFSIK